MPSHYGKKKPMKPPKKGGTPKKITTKNKPGHTGPGGANSPKTDGYVPPPKLKR